MADAKVSALTQLAEAPADGDELVVVDKSDTTDAASGTTKRLTALNLHQGAIKSVTAAAYASTYISNAATYPGLVLAISDTQGGLLLRSNGSAWVSIAASVGIPATGINTVVTAGIGGIASGTSAGTNRLYLRPIEIPFTQTITGVAYTVSGTSNGNVRSALFTGDGATIRAQRTTNLGMAAANTAQQIAFDALTGCSPGTYLAAIIFSSATATYVADVNGISVNTNNTNMVIPSTVTPPTAMANLSAPQLMLY